MDRKDRVASRGDLADTIGDHRDIRLARIVPTPGEDRAITLEGDRVIEPRRQLHHVGGSGRHISLRVGVVAPRLDRSVA